jgi:hypothetical protein
MKKTFLILIFLLFGKPLYAKGSNDAIEINLNIIEKIESSNGKRMYGTSGEIGWHQVTPICRKDYNLFHSKKIKRQDLMDREISLKVADWYYHKRIPHFLKKYKLKGTLENTLLCYQSGIYNLRIGRIGQKGWNYLAKYKQELNKL